MILKWLNLSMHKDITLLVIVYFDRARGLMLDRYTANSHTYWEVLVLSNLDLNDLINVKNNTSSCVSINKGKWFCTRVSP